MPRSRSQSLECRQCGCRLSTVTDTRIHEIKVYGRMKTLIRRRRVCHYCKLPFTTIETYESEDLPLTAEPEDTRIPAKRPLAPSDGVYSPLAAVNKVQPPPLLPPEKNRRPAGKAPKGKAGPPKKTQTKGSQRNPYLPKG